MERFKPANTSVWKKVLGSPFLYISLTFAVVFASIFYVRESRREELRARVEYLRGGPVLVERKQVASETQNAAPQDATNLKSESNPVSSEEVNSGTAASTAPIEEKAAVPPSQPAPAPSVAPTPTSTTMATSKQAESSSVKPVGNRVSVIYAEIDRTTLNAWTEEIRANGFLRSFDEVSMGPVPHIAQKMKSSRGVKILQQLDHPFRSSSHTPIEWFVGTRRTPDPENEMGFFTSLVLGDLKDGLIRGQIEVQRAFRDPKDPGRIMERISYGSSFEMAAGSGFIMRGLLPRKYYAINIEDEVNPDPFLSILKSSDFRNGQSEFTLILEFDTSGAQQR